MPYKKITVFDTNKENPFLDDAVMHIQKGTKTILMGSNKSDILIDSRTGEAKGHSVFFKKTDVDKAQFAKVYISNLASFFGLSKAGIKIFGFVLSITKINKDYVDFDYSACMEFTGYKSKKAILTGLAELLENGFIARGKHTYHFFINPTIFWNGDRISFFNQIAKKTESKHKEIAK